MTGSPRVRLLAGSVLISFSSILANLTTVAPTVSAFYRVAIGGVVLLAITLLRSRPGARFARGRVPIASLVAGSIFFALDLAFWHRSIAFVGPGLSTLLAGFQVFFMTAAGVVWFRQRLSALQVAAIPIAFVGLAMVVGLDWSALSPEHRAGVAYGLATGLVYAGYLLSLRQSQTGGDGRLPVAELCAVSLGSAALLGVTAGIEGHSLSMQSFANAGWLTAYAVLCHVGGWLLIASSLPHLRTAVAGLMLTLQPVLTMVWDVLLFGRGLSWVEGAGALLAVTGIYLGSIPRRKAAR